MLLKSGAVKFKNKWQSRAASGGEGGREHWEAQASVRPPLLQISQQDNINNNNAAHRHESVPGELIGHRVWKCVAQVRSLPGSCPGRPWPWPAARSPWLWSTKGL